MILPDPHFGLFIKVHYIVDVELYKNDSIWSPIEFQTYAGPTGKLDVSI